MSRIMYMYVLENENEQCFACSALTTDGDQTVFSEQKAPLLSKAKFGAMACVRDGVRTPASPERFLL